ncbi:MAG: hypothetical protein ACU4F9_09980 [Arcticibacter sp.]
MSFYSSIRKVILQLFFLLLLSGSVYAQHYLLPLSFDLNARYDSTLNRISSNVHTSSKPYAIRDIQSVGGSDTFPRFGKGPFAKSESWLSRKLFREHLLEVKGEDYFLALDPIMEFAGGISSETDTTRNTYTNSRGFRVEGYFGKGFSFQSTFVETQAEFPGYVDSAVRSTFVVPGGGRTKKLYGGFDYGVSSGSISYALPKYFDFQLGYDRNFIGDGYRSLLLSDNAYQYPFLKINTTFWKVKYMVMYAMFLDGPDGKGEDRSYRRKYGTFHYLDVNIGKRLTIGLLESVIWKYDSTRAFDITYMNPVIFLRPVEFSIGSPDNALIGLNLKYKLTDHHHLYAQAILDEFKIREVRAGDGWWGNKHGFQLGWRAFSLFGVHNLDVGTEFNYVRPYTYQHRSSATAYAHFNQPLAHPLGANFSESVSSIAYSFKRWSLLSRISIADVGYDFNNALEQVNYGNNVLLSYESRPDEYGNSTGQGLNTNVLNVELRLSYLINPSSNLVLEAGSKLRSAENTFGKMDTRQFWLGLRNVISNRYLDF